MPVRSAPGKTGGLATVRPQPGHQFPSPARHTMTVLKRPAGSHSYGRSAVIWPQDTMPLRPRVQNPYDHTSAKSTMLKKCVTPITQGQVLGRSIRFDVPLSKRLLVDSLTRLGYLVNEPFHGDASSTINVFPAACPAKPPSQADTPLIARYRKKTDSTVIFW